LQRGVDNIIKTGWIERGRESERGGRNNVGVEYEKRKTDGRNHVPPVFMSFYFFLL